MTTPKQLWLLAGGNGAGKSTFYEQFLKPRAIPFVNADIIARELYPDAPESNSYAASRIAQELRDNLLRKGQNFCFETVFSQVSKIDSVGTAKALGYEIILVFIDLDNDDLNNARVAQRVTQGGHFVPDEKVHERIPRTLCNIKTAIVLCNRIVLLDNSSLANPFRQVASLENGMLVRLQDPLPPWALEMLAGYN